MTADSSSAAATHSGDGGINSPSGRRSLPSDDSDGGHCGNAGGEKKSAWSKPSANGVIEGATTTPVMGAASWPALSESTRSVPKSLSSLESCSKPTSDGLVTVLEVHFILCFIHNDNWFLLL